MDETRLTIGEVSRRTGLTERTLRYYEELGLLAPVEARLLRGGTPSDAELLDLLAGLGDEPMPTRRLTLLVCRDLEAAHDHLVQVLGLAPGPLSRDGDGVVQHGEVGVGDGVVWLHPERPDVGLLSPATSGSASACLAVQVDDAAAHHARLVAAGATVEYPPTEMPYGVVEYGARDLDGHLWSFQQTIDPTGEDPR